MVRALLFSTWLAAASLASAQAALPSLQVPFSFESVCHSERYPAARQLTFSQRGCWYGTRMASPWGALKAGFSSGIGQWENRPFKPSQDGDDYAVRFATYYARRGARNGAEMLAGYLHHEDPRPVVSGRTVFQKRVESALLSVLISPGDGGNRLALAPLAGSLGSAFAGLPGDNPRNRAQYLLERSAATYSAYFVRALLHEFRPDITFYVTRALHRPKPE